MLAHIDYWRDAPVWTADKIQTATADYADWLLPATTFLEHADVYTSYGHYHLQYADPVVPPRGQARSNRWFFARLAERLGLDEPSLAWDTPRLVEELLSSDHPWLAGITAEELRAKYDIPIELNDAVVAYVRFFQTDTREHFARWLARAARWLGFSMAVISAAILSKFLTS